VSAVNDALISAVADTSATTAAAVAAAVCLDALAWDAAAALLSAVRVAFAARGEAAAGTPNGAKVANLVATAAGDVLPSSAEGSHPLVGLRAVRASGCGSIRGGGAPPPNGGRVPVRPRARADAWKPLEPAHAPAGWGVWFRTSPLLAWRASTPWRGRGGGRGERVDGASAVVGALVRLPARRRPAAVADAAAPSRVGTAAKRISCKAAALALWGSVAAVSAGE